MTAPGIALYFTPLLRSREATRWKVRDGGAQNRRDSRSSIIGTIERRHQRQNTRRFSASQVSDEAHGEKGLDTMGIARERETAPFNELLSRMIFLA